MKIQKIVLSGFFISTCMMTALPSFANAQEVSPVKGVNKTANCTKATTRINELITKLQNSEEVRQGRHQKTIDRINAVITKFNAKNINTDKLKSDVVVMTTKKAHWEQQYAILLTKLNATKQYACGSSEGKFRQAVKDAKDQRHIMREANMDFWNFVKNTVKPDVKESRGQFKK